MFYFYIITCNHGLNYGNIKIEMPLHMTFKGQVAYAGFTMGFMLSIKLPFPFLPLPTSTLLLSLRRNPARELHGEAL